MKLNFISQKHVINYLVKSFSILFFLFFAVTLKAQNQTVSLSSGIMLKDAFIEIEKQTRLSVDYNNQTVNANATLKKAFTNARLSEVLPAILSEVNCTYTIQGSHILVSPNSPKQEARQIAGTIVDPNGEPLIGANVMMKGTMNGTVTDIDGKFSLTVSENATLQVAFVGYIAQEISIVAGGGKPLVIKLIEDAQALEEVVIVGYGSIKKSDLTGSVSSIKTAELQQTPMVSIDQGLVGRASGVQVTQTSGMPGATASIRVRGSSSLQGGNEPLYVIDGFPVYSGGGFGNTGGKTSLSGLSTVNPSDIESIEILKDAAATAIYGARAANGVVLVTTKSGKKGHDIITFESNFGVSNVSKIIDVLDAQEYAVLVNEAYTNDGLSPYYDAAALSDIAIRGKGTDWQDEIFRTGISQNYIRIIYL
jgi:TonB-linked SusC/RagA family outer membrane protein